MKSESFIKIILEMYRMSQSYITPKASKYGITRGQWYFFNRLLLNQDGISQEQLSEEMHVNSAHTSRAIKSLEDKGFVYREKDTEDERKKNIYVTEKSEEIKDDYHSIYKELNKILVKDFTDEEIELCRSFLDKMRDNISSYIDENNPDK